MITHHSEKEQLELHRLMVLGRALERALSALSHRWKKHWFTAIGEDGVVVGATYGLDQGDVVATHYRGSLIAGMIRGVPLQTLVAACLGTVESYSRGRLRGDVAGSFEHGLVGCYSGNLGPHLSYGTGAAWAMKLQQRKNIAVVMFGDGTAHRGEFHEAANFAAIKKLPVVYVCQNNQYTIASSLAEQTACRTFADRAIGYGMPGAQVDGNDVLAVRTAVGNAIDHARRGAGPTLIDALTYRAHGGYGDLIPREQPAAEIEAWLKKDPLDRLEKHLLENGLLTTNAIDACHEQAKREVAEAIAAAEQGVSGNLSHPRGFTSWLVHVPGIKVVMASTAYDAKGLWKSAIRDNNPVVIIEPMGLYLGEEEEIPDEEYLVPIGKADIKRHGADISIISAGEMTQRALKAAEILSQENIDIEVVDLRTLAPMDMGTVLESVSRTRRALIVHADWKIGGFGAEIAASIAEHTEKPLKTRVRRLAPPHLPPPYPPELESAFFPTIDDIVFLAKQMMCEQQADPDILRESTTKLSDIPQSPE